MPPDIRREGYGPSSLPDFTEWLETTDGDLEEWFEFLMSQSS